MTLVKLGTKVKVRHYAVNANYLAYTVDNRFIIANLKGEYITEFKFHDKLTSPIRMQGNLIWVGTGANYKSITYFQNEFNIVDVLFSNFAFKELCFYARYFEEGGTSFACKIGMDKKIRWKTKDRGFGQNFLTESLFIHRSALASLTALNNQTGEELWTYTLPKEFDYTFLDEHKEAQIASILGVYNHIVWLRLSSYALVGLDIVTGKLIKHIVNLDYFEDAPSKKVAENNRALFNSPTQLDTEQGIIFTCVSDRYAEVDLNQENYPYSVWNLETELAKQPSFSDKHHFSVSGIGGWEGDTVYIYDKGDSHCFGAFDRKTKKIIWSEILPGDKYKDYYIRDLKYAPGYLYLQDNESNLRIYALESKEASE